MPHVAGRGSGLLPILVVGGLAIWWATSGPQEPAPGPVDRAPATKPAPRPPTKPCPPNRP